MSKHYCAYIECEWDADCSSGCVIECSQMSRLGESLSSAVTKLAGFFEKMRSDVIIRLTADPDNQNLKRLLAMLDETLERGGASDERRIYSADN